MSIRVFCECGNELAVADVHAGKRVKCPGCSGVVDVPGGESRSTYPPVKANRRCHEVDYQIVGDDLQMVIIELDGFILQKLVGDGMAFIHAGGTIIERELRGETLRVDTGCLVAFEPHIQYNIERAGNLKSMFLGGEGLFLATLRGKGRVWLQSLPMRRPSERIVANAGSRGKDEGSLLGPLGNMFDGD